MIQALTYDPEGKGENYGIRYHLADPGKLLKAIRYLVLEKGMKVPLPSHHGLGFRLNVLGGLRLCIVALGWTHGNKGNGKLKTRIYIVDEEWHDSITRFGDVQRVQGLLMTEDSKVGFVKMVEAAGFSIKEESKSRNGVYVNIEDDFDFVARIKIDGDGKEAPNFDYEKTLWDFIQAINETFDAYNSLR